MLKWIYCKSKKEVVKPVEIVFKYNDLNDVAYKEYGHTVNKNENFYETKIKLICVNTLAKNI
jgi:hypothetical protein